MADWNEDDFCECCGTLLGCMGECINPACKITILRGERDSLAAQLCHSAAAITSLREELDGKDAEVAWFGMTPKGKVLIHSAMPTRDRAWAMMIILTGKETSKTCMENAGYSVRKFQLKEVK